MVGPKRFELHPQWRYPPSLLSFFHFDNSERLNPPRICNKPRENQDSTDRAQAYRDEPDLNELVNGFKEWSKYKECLIFRIENKYTYEKRWRAVQASKRGNEVYSKRLRQRLKHLYDLPEVKAFDHKDRSEKKSTNILFVTLTYRRDRVLQSAWGDCGKDNNRFMASMRKKYGSISVLRSFEAQRDGFPHFTY